jgi:16S rRNA (uracil1498-N3)-methyltransferase
MKQPPRFAMSLPPDGDGIARVSRDEAHHMRDVMRLQPGDAVVLIDDIGTRFVGKLGGYDRDGARVQVSSNEAAHPRPQLIVAPAVVKGPRMDFIVEKAAELGATELWPTVCARCVGKAPGAERITRWRRLATAASKQSLVAPPMQVRDADSFAGLLRNVPRDTLALICAAGAMPMLEALVATRASGLLIASGPEGDFAPDELESATAGGFVPVGLGPNRLRSETAAIAAIAIAHQWLNRQS